MATCSRHSGTIVAVCLLESEDYPYDQIEKLPILGISLALGHRAVKAKIPRYLEDVVDFYTEEQFKTFFRMSRSTYEFLLGHIYYLQHVQDIQIQQGGQPPVPLEKQLLMTLWYLGSKGSVRSIADRFNISESTFINLHRKILTYLCDLSHQIITWPSEDEMTRIAETIEEKTKFPGVVGAVDGTHIAIEAPYDHGQDYYNRKGYFSIILQAVCREDCRFTNIYCGWPGKVHDARIFRNSPLYIQGQELCNNNHILGDCAYPIKSWVLTPYKDNGHLTPQQKLYNKKHSSARVIIENSFGILKSRFPRLQYVAVRDVKNIVKVVVAAATLHTLCIAQYDELDEGPLQNDEPQPDILYLENQDGRGVQKRLEITAQLAENLNV